MTPGKLNLTLIPGTIFGPFVLYFKDDDEAPVDLTGYNVFAEVRLRPGSNRVIIDLEPTVTDGAAGEVTIPMITDEDTFDMKFVHARWSLVLEEPGGDRTGPFIEGKFIIRGTPTHPIET